MSALAEAIEKAQTEIDKVVANGDKGRQSETPKETKDKEEKPKDKDTEQNNESTKEDEGESEEVEVEDLSDIDLANAKQLFKSLKDPAQAPLVIDFLAKQAGYSKAPENKTEAKKEAKDLIDRLKDSAGPELEFLVDKIGPTIKDYLTEQVEGVRSEFQNAEARRENEKLVSDTKVAITGLAQKYYKQDEFPKDVYVEINKLMDKIQPSATMSPSEYIEMLYFTVAGKKGINVNQLQKVDRNRDDVPSRIEGQRGAKAQAVKETPRKMTLNESVKAAMEQLEKGEG